MPKSEMVQSVLKALDLLRAATEAPNGMRLNELAAAVDLKKTTAHNLVRTLCARGFLVKDAANRFVPGVAIRELARHGKNNAVLAEASRQMRELGLCFPAAVITFTELTPAAIACRLRLSPDRPGELQHPLERLHAPYVSVTAVCLQATGSNAAEFERTFPFQEYGVARWKTNDSFLKEKAAVRRRGYCMQRHLARLAIAFPVPENYALGFSMENPPDDFPKAVKARVAVFLAAIGKLAPGTA